MENPRPFLDALAQKIYQKKGVNILAIDVRGVSTMTDFFLIAEGNVPRHVKALAEAVLNLCKEAGLAPPRTEGLKLADWVVVDLGNIVIHILTSELRYRFELEEVWRAGELVDLSLSARQDEVNT